MDVNKVAKVRLVNDKNIVNKNMKVYNGTGHMDVQVYPWGNSVLLGTLSNGKQFSPRYTDGNLHIYDNKFVRPLSYKYDSDYESNSFKYKKFTGELNF